MFAQIALATMPALFYNEKAVSMQLWLLLRF
jgi:hypothetical protein